MLHAARATARARERGREGERERGREEEGEGEEACVRACVFFSFFPFFVGGRVRFGFGLLLYSLFVVLRRGGMGHPSSFLIFQKC